MVLALEDYRTIHEEVSTLKRREAGPPADFQKWETLYREHLSPLNFQAAYFPPQVQRLEVSLPATAREFLTQAEKI